MLFAGPPPMGRPITIKAPHPGSSNFETVIFQRGAEGLSEFHYILRVIVQSIQIRIRSPQLWRYVVYPLEMCLQVLQLYLALARGRHFIAFDASRRNSSHKWCDTLDS